MTTDDLSTATWMDSQAESNRPGSVVWSRLDNAGAIVIGGDYRGLGVVRSLGRRGIPVWVLTDEHKVAAASRYARRSLSWPEGDEVRQVNYLLDLGRRYRLDGWALFPTGDETAALISRHHAELAARFRLTTPPWEALRWAYDKRLTYSLASELDIDHPWTRYPRSREEVASLDCPFPVYLKPAIKREANSFTTDKAWRVETRQELLARYDEACLLVDPDIIMLQEMVPGGGESQFSYAALCIQGNPVASIVARRTRQYPMEIGHASTYVETVCRPEIEDPSRRLLAAMSNTGLVELEFKHDRRDGCYKLLDINARIWGWHTLGEHAGVDFSYLVWKLINGERLSEVRARSGVRWARMVMDIPAVYQEIRSGQLSLHSYIRSLHGPLGPAIFAWDDPFPALADVPLLVRLALRRSKDTTS